MVTCFCNVSYNSSFSLLSKRASFSRLDLPLLGGRAFSSLTFLIGVSDDSTNLMDIFLLRASPDGDAARALEETGSLTRLAALVRRRLDSGSSSSEEISVDDSSYTLCVRFLELRRALSSLAGTTFFFGSCGSKMSPEG